VLRAAVIVVAIVAPACGRLDFDSVAATSDAITSTDGNANDTNAAAPVFVQAASGTIGGSTTVEATFGAATTGNVMAVAVSWDGGATMTGITDTNNDTYILVGSTLTGLGANGQIAYASITGNGVITVTAQLSASSTGISMIAHEIRGAASNPLASSNAQYQFMPGNATDALSSGALSLPGSENHVFAACFNVSGNDAVYTHGTGFTQALSGTRGSATFMSEYATQAMPATFTLQSSNVGGHMTLAMVFR
jgi:hypothetical protein